MSEDKHMAVVGAPPTTLDRVAEMSPRETFHLILSNWLAEKADRTVETYKTSMVAFGAFCEEDPLIALEAWIRMPPDKAYRTLAAYKAHLLQRELKPATVNQRLSCLRSFSKHAAEAFGTTPVSIGDVRQGKVSKIGKSITDDQWEAIVEHLQAQRDCNPPGSREEAEAVRSLAIVRLLRDVGLRRKEVVEIQLEDVHFEHKVVTIHPKGPRDSAEDWPVDGKAWECLVEWMEIRGNVPGPLFGFASVRYANKLLTELGKALGFRLTPHMLRHHGISAVDRLADKDLAQRFARHVDGKTTERYLHNDHTDAIRQMHRKLGEGE